VPVLETLSGLRIVASVEALDTAIWPEGTLVLRLAPDDVFALGAAEVGVTDEHAIVAPESGFAGAWLTVDEVRDRIIPHIEWPLPEARPTLCQGLIAGVPAKLWLEGERALLLCAAAYAHELSDRTG